MLIFFFPIMSTIRPISDLIWLTPTTASTSNRLGWCNQEGKRQSPHLPLQRGLRRLMLGTSFYFSTSSQIEKHTQLISPGGSAPIPVTGQCEKNYYYKCHDSLRNFWLTLCIVLDSHTARNSKTQEELTKNHTFFYKTLRSAVLSTVFTIAKSNNYANTWARA